MEYVSENIKKQKEIGTVLGMIDEVNCTKINKLVGKENVVLYSNEEYRKLFKVREIVNVVNSNENLIVTASGKQEVEELKRILAPISADVFSFSENEDDIKINYQTLGSKSALNKTLRVNGEYECASDTVEDAIMLSKIEMLPETLKSENGIALKDYFKADKSKILIIDVSKATEQVASFLLNLLKLSCEELENDISVTVIDDTKLLNKNSIHSEDKVRTILLTSENDKEKVENAIAIHVNEEYTVVLGDEWLLLKTPTAEEMKSI